VVSIDSTSIAGRSVDLKFRDYVSANYWPNKEASGSKLQQMFDKVMEASKLEGEKKSNGS
jgi:chromodomain-helicase-DNA-binding protein 1